MPERNMGVGERLHLSIVVLLVGETEFKDL